MVVGRLREEEYKLRYNYEGGRNWLGIQVPAADCAEEKIWSFISRVSGAIRISVL